MRVALIESNIIWENKDLNIKRLKDNLEKLSTEGIDIVLLPEMSFTGFSMNVSKTNDCDHESYKQIEELSSDYNVMIGFGWVDKDINGYKNHYSIVKSNKTLIDYEKIHPFSYGGEDKVFCGGGNLRTADICGFKMGVQICYDLRFPEVFQFLSKTSDIIIVPANWPQRRELHWDVLLQARAIENQVYIAGINCRGEMDGLDYSGHSTIYKPNGEKVKEEKIKFINDCNICIYEINNDVNKYRESFPVKNDRRESLYQKLLNMG